MARAMVTSSAYSMSLPAGTPVAMRVIFTDGPRNAVASQLAVASPSRVGLVAIAALHGADAGRFFHDAYQALVARGAGAIGARIHIGHVVADGAEAKVRL